MTIDERAEKLLHDILISLSDEHVSAEFTKLTIKDALMKIHHEGQLEGMDKLTKALTESNELIMAKAVGK